MHHYGIRGLALDWFKSYLNERKQCVFLNDISSDYLPITCGVPQGSILGPLLFIIYVNDIINCSDLLYFVIFADDTNIVYSDLNMESLIRRLNLELLKLSNWFRANRLLLNLKKTNLIHFHSRTLSLPQGRDFVQIDNHKIEEVQSIKFLGIIIDEKLSWKNHVLKITSAISKSIGVINKVKYKLPVSALLCLYNALVLSHLNYCCLVWGWAAATTLDPILKLQKRQ